MRDTAICYPSFQPLFSQVEAISYFHTWLYGGWKTIHYATILPIQFEKNQLSALPSDFIRSTYPTDQLHLSGDPLKQ